MSKHKNLTRTESTTLEQLVANTCFCKLKAICPDKNSSDCMRHQNIYAEFMQKKLEERSR